jgi:hypothetical protein
LVLHNCARGNRGLACGGGVVAMVAIATMFKGTHDQLQGKQTAEVVRHTLTILS